MERVLSLENYDVIQADDGSRALEVLAGRSVDLVITDIDMPVMGGVELLRRLRASNCPVPVIAMSGDFDTQLALHEGFEAFFCKPFKISLVLELVSDVIGKKRKVLIVDDMQEMRTVVRTMVAQLGFRSFEAGNGAEALSVLKAQGADLVITDCAMPVMDGRDLLAEVQKRYPDLRIIVTSANFKVEDAETMKPFGFLRKPYRMDELKKVVLDAMASTCQNGPEREKS